VDEVAPIRDTISPLCACVYRTFVQSKFVAPASRDFEEAFVGYGVKRAKNAAASVGREPGSTSGYLHGIGDLFTAFRR
jgi:hypothetical protein